jgi:hypothetical protein
MIACWIWILQHLKQHAGRGVYSHIAYIAEKTYDRAINIEKALFFALNILTASA